MSNLLSSIISIILIVLIAVFAIANQQTAQLAIVPFIEKYNMPVYLIVFVSMLFGFFIGLFISSLKIIKINLKNRSLNKKIKNYSNTK